MAPPGGRARGALDVARAAPASSYAAPRTHRLEEPVSRMNQELFFVGIKHSVVALDPREGREVWRTKLKGSSFVTVLWDGEALLAASQGEVFRLDPASGAVVWQNPMKGLGLGLVSMASSRRAESSTPYETIAEQHRREAAHAAAAAAG